ncbi:MAG: endonuclease III [Deltaproteobacteria bacterium GWA2_57_13]|nr:MAG: endonuclease III [Deltaproteobacteria bacterium GWA2_57_13]OGQ51456.1 MAG: endonuclease III [Deltaproteobacteria bacterium RIFCSPLOWO2_02_FULL_57_26]OGQ85057.1 MAG: endonuclease III [Deltaproteobacteria bacterium RIFCSPLOWO2_12_FULL_57_22]
MTHREIHQAIRILRREVPKWQTPIVTVVAQSSESPFHVLISCILSLRTQDATTAQASRRLFALAGTPAEMRRLSTRKIEKAIYPVGFYRTKAKTIREICRTLIENYAGRVPDEIDELLKLKGVGRKTANLVVTLGYRKPGICVDTHVHRISNRWGYVRTKNPKETEFALRQRLPKRYWIEYNDLLVSFGQHLCRPISPMCSQCPVEKYCDKVGVKIHR